MKEPLLVLKVEITEGNKMQVTLGTRHEALLALAIRKAEMYLMEVMIDNEVPPPVILKPESGIQIPEGIITRL